MRTSPHLRSKAMATTTRATTQTAATRLTRRNSSNSNMALHLNKATVIMDTHRNKAIRKANMDKASMDNMVDREPQEAREALLKANAGWAQR